MKIKNPIGKQVEIIPCGGGEVKRGQILNMSLNHVTLLKEDGTEDITPLVRSWFGSTVECNIRLTADQVIEDIQDQLSYKIKPEGKELLKEILRIHKGMLSND